MPRGTAHGLLAFLRRLPPAPDSDDALLDRFARDRDADAFAALVARHGPMVFAVCSRALGSRAEAEDAFQAVFVALARDAGRVGARGTVSGWLYRVALRTARRLATRGRVSDPLPPDVPAPDPPDAARRELLAALDDEVNALPERLRAAVVLCAMEGLTNTEAATVLGCPVGTVDSRLHAAKRKLHDRLVRRGFGLPAVGAGITALALETAGNADTARRLAAVLTTTAGAPPAPAVATILQEIPPVRRSFKPFALGLGLVLAGAGFALYALAQPPLPPPSRPAPDAVPLVPDPNALPPRPQDPEKAYRNALVAAIHRLSEHSWDCEHLAAMLERHPKLANERIEYEQPRKPSSADSYTAIHYAAQNGNSRAVALLLHYKVDPNTPAGLEWTPLHFAARHGHLETCRVLIKGGAKPGAKTAALPERALPSGPPNSPPVMAAAIPAYTPLELAKMGKHAAVVEYLTGLEGQRGP
ncbi:MAG: sigma-70 family RNA polymerase sigma factor [Planctomycetes bacterium]|nr:sigma-70 family RNA polymerase sigma factor [Planctomycetota bacterium]